MADFRSVLEGAIEFDTAGGQRGETLERATTAEFETSAGRDRGVAIAVVIGLIGEAAGKNRRTEAATGIGAARFERGHAELPEPTLGARPRINGEIARLRGAVAGECIPLSRAGDGRAACEDLHHATDCIGTVERRTWSAHDLHTLDQFEGQILNRCRAQGRRAPSQSVDEHQVVVRFGAANEERTGLADATVVGYDHAR